MKLHERGLAMSKILIVEDERPIADLIMMNLTRAGYQCDYASNGKRVLQILRRITLNLTDMRLRYVMMEQVALRLHCMRILICVSLISCFPELMVSRYASR